ncbi:nucleotidyltransferase family protein [Aeromonas rivipollensis]|uniref:nucleotidyltransferase family protein n=1 Tax=Aeromonas rivipollensis TaxID=948519 RepID=UPI001F1FAE42|nr:nucleotidyltransferase family protein [Aeromonas rivipollensis]MCE9945906.1 nucleotidyltransferase family protein [Aeromonas rivipollensis]
MGVEAQAAREAQLQARTEALLRADPLRMACLWAARELALPDWALGAGFVRNLTWDHLHQKAEPTPLNDIDLIYLDPGDPEGADEREHEAWLAERLPGQRWEVRNQARMHVRQQVPPFASSLEALSHWVEVPTCIGVRLLANDEFEWLAPHGFGHNWSLQVSANPRCRQESRIFIDRIRDKQWQRIWPDLVVNWP